MIQGFRSPDGHLFEAGLSCEEDWDNLRRLAASALVVKMEPGSSDDDDDDDDACGTYDEVREVALDRIFNVQPTCSDHFKDGRSLSETISDLKEGRLNHLHHEDFVLNVCMARIRQGRGRRGRRVPKKHMFWTLDHRRLECLRRAGCHTARVRIKLCGPAFDEFMNKGAKDDLGTRTDIVVEAKRRRL